MGSSLIVGVLPAKAAKGRISKFRTDTSMMTTLGVSGV